MRKLFSTLLGASVLLAAIGWFTLKPTPVMADAELVSITPDATDITDQLGAGAPSVATLFGWVGTIDQEYTAVFSVDEEPVLLVTPGADIDPANPWVYDSTAGTVTVTFTLHGLVDDSFKGMPAGSGVAIVAMMGESEDGPPAEMAGAWMSTNLQDWEILPPTPDRVAFGFNLTGPSGESGYFRMFIPNAVVDLMNSFSEKDISIDDLAVFVDDQQASLDLTVMEGGAYIDINVTFSEASTAVTSSEVTKKVTTKAQLPISLSAKKTEVSQGTDARLYGWISQAKANKTITLYRKLKGETEFSAWKTVKTNSQGYFSTKYKAGKTATYKAKYDGKVSELLKVTVN